MQSYNCGQCRVLSEVRGSKEENVSMTIKNCLVLQSIAVEEATYKEWQGLREENNFEGSFQGSVDQFTTTEGGLLQCC